MNTRSRSESGQAILLVVLALATFLLVAVGLAVDSAQLYAQRQMAQTAADAAAQAGALSILNNAFSTDAATAGTPCGSADTRTPCEYAALNGFGGKAGDTVTYTLPAAEHIRVTVERVMPTSFMRTAGIATAKVSVEAEAVVVPVESPIPILVLHPKLPGALSLNTSAGGGDATITVTGGPPRSIQVNSAALGTKKAAAIDTSSGHMIIDLSKAGPDGSGGELGVRGTPHLPDGTLTMVGGDYTQPVSYISDPYAWFNEASELKARCGAVNPATSTISKTAAVRYGCPTGMACVLYSPGDYTGGINNKDYALFKPGLYCTGGNGFANAAGGQMKMAQGVGTNALTGKGMTAYNYATKGVFDLSGGADANLIGAEAGYPLFPFLFFNTRNAEQHVGSKAHQLAGNGTITLIGTIYITNTEADMWAEARYQQIRFHGTPGSTTSIVGEIITGAIDMRGGSGISMHLDKNMHAPIRKVALIK